MFFFRSWLFVPGNQEDKLDKSSGLSSDVVVYDLEDSVPVDAKQTAFELVKRQLQKGGGIRFVRVNACTDPRFTKDLEVVDKNLAGIMLPKVNRKEDVERADRLVSLLEEHRGLPLGSTEIVPLVETAEGLYHAMEIARASPRVRRLAFGSLDFALDVNARPSKEGTELLYARSRLVFISRVAGIEPPIDGVFPDLRDQPGLERDASAAKRIGFQGKMVIHPNQIDIVNRVFSPTPEEIEEARSVVDAYYRGLSEGKGAVQQEGNMIDAPVVERARRILVYARQLEKGESPSG